MRAGTYKSNEKNDQIYEKNIKFKNEIRVRQRQAMFNIIRKQYQAQNSQNNAENWQYMTQEYPLRSVMLQKYHHLSHAQISSHLDQIANHLLQYNIYLSQFQKQSQEQEMNEQFFDDQQSLLIRDLFYLTMEHQGRFSFPRKFKFIRNGDNLVASYVAIVSTEISPEELAYWVSFMNDEDRNILYLNIMGADEISTEPSKNFHYQTWVNHPILRNFLLSDFPHLQSAGKAVRQIVGFRQVHPDRLKNSKGESLYEILCNMFSDELEGMIQISQSHKVGKFQKCKLTAEHLQTSVRVIEAKYLSNEQPNQLHELLSKIISNRVQSHILQISPLFCTWVVDALLKHSIYLLSGVGYEILINIMMYDPDTYTSNNTVSGHRIRKQKLDKFCQMVIEKYQKVANIQCDFNDSGRQRYQEDEEESQNDRGRMEEENK